MAAFSDVWLRSVVGKPYTGKSEITYRNGLGVRISAKGKITWIYRFLMNGKPVKMKIGGYPELKIKAAEMLKDEKAELVALGIDPRLRDLSLINDKDITLNKLIDEWYKNYAKYNILLCDTEYNFLKKHISETLGPHKVNKLSIRDYTRLINEIKSKKATSAVRILKRLKQVLSYGVKFGYLEQNVLLVLTAKDIAVIDYIRRVKQDKSGIGAHYALIDRINTTESNRNLLRLMTIFACRSIELRLASKSEFDLNRLVWTVPKEHNKTRKAGGGDIIRAIPEFAVSIIREQFLMNDSGYMFTQTRNEDKPPSRSAMQYLGTKHGELLELHGFVNTRNHDIRRTARNVWEQMRFPYRVAEVMLGHKVHTGVQEHYNEYDYIEEQRECYKDWCAFIAYESTDFKKKLSQDCM